MKITFQREPWYKVRPLITPLLDAHAREAETWLGYSTGHPDFAKADNAYRAGLDHWFTARRGAELVGYFFALIDTTPFDRTTKIGTVVAYFLRADCREGRTGDIFLAAAEESLWGRGVVRQYSSVPSSDQARGPAKLRMFQRRGWKVYEHAVVKER